MIKLKGGPFDGKESEDINVNFTVFRDGKPLFACYRDGEFKGYTTSEEQLPKWLESELPVVEVPKATKPYPQVDEDGVLKKKDEGESESPEPSDEEDEKHLGDFT